ncbi:MAG: hypothetical protein GY865_19715, partial [candidate division Zixibacteria bacterium]|nr:hypothetical protein [candidate division Zixibacteria bacterium]
MNRKLLLMSIGLIFLLTIAIIAASGERRGEAIKVEIIPGSMQLDTDRAACQMYKFDPNTTSITYLTGYGNGDGIVTYFDPTDAAANGCGVAAVYPFEISSLTFMLWNQDGAVWPVGIDVVVYDLATPGDPCGGPGALLCSETVSCDLATFGGTFGTVTFSSPCCVSGPFYIGIHYNDAGSSTTFPGFVSDASDIAPAPVLCDLWDMYLGGSWTEWYSAGWGDPPPNYLLYAVDGETESAVCDDDPWAHHKMHWPQLPDEDGWDVHVDMPMFLADDWTCSETGPITDIHWWGSWLDEQEGVINEFIINIWADVPADPLDPMSYSHPGVHLHSINAPAGSFAITPLMPEEPTMFEDWYDPSAPLVIVDDHQEYFRYDLILDEIDFFDQVEGTVYWLSIECLVEDDGLGKQWGWKNTQDHHLDDAVYYDGQDGWVEIYEYADTLKNWFEIQIDPTGAFVNGVGIGAYMDPTEPPIYP